MFKPKQRFKISRRLVKFVNLISGFSQKKHIFATAGLKTKVYLFHTTPAYKRISPVKIH